MYYELVPPPFFFQMIIFSMHLYTSNERHACFHLYGASRPARSASKATQSKIKISCPQWDSTQQPWNLKSDALPFELTSLKKDVLCKWLLCIHVGIYIYIVHISKETHTSCVCFQHANARLCRMVGLVCMLKANKGLVRLFAICTI